MVLLSARGEVEAEQAERALQAAGADRTILRASWFFQNFSENFFLHSILSGEIALPAGLAAEPFVAVDDIADVAAVALTNPAHVGQIYDLTGPSALTFAEPVEEIARATGGDIIYRGVTPEEYRESLIQADVPIATVNLVCYLFANLLDGRNTPVSDGLQRALGRAPRDFSAYVRDVAAKGIWGG